MTDFLPNLKGLYAKEVTIGDLSSMSSGQKYGMRSIIIRFQLPQHPILLMILIN